MRRIKKNRLYPIEAHFELAECNAANAQNADGRDRRRRRTMIQRFCTGAEHGKKPGGRRPEACARYHPTPLRKRTSIALCTFLLTLMSPYLCLHSFSKDGFAAVVLIPAAGGDARRADSAVRQEKINSLLETVRLLNTMIAIFTASLTAEWRRTRPARLCGLPGDRCCLLRSLPGGLRHRLRALGCRRLLGVLPRLLFLRCRGAVFFNYQLCRAFGGDRYICAFPARRAFGRPHDKTRGKNYGGRKQTKLRLRLSAAQTVMSAGGYGECALGGYSAAPNTPEEFANRLLEIHTIPLSFDHRALRQKKRQEAAKPEKSDRHKKQHSGARCAAEK